MPDKIITRMSRMGALFKFHLELAAVEKLSEMHQQRDANLTIPDWNVCGSITFDDRKQDAEKVKATGNI